jgi:flagellar hook-associated protein 1 FlgK
MSGLYSLLDISRRSLLNQSRALQVVGQNVANIGTEGYNKRDVTFVDRTSPNARTEAFGLGADIKEVTRRVDEFIDKNLRADLSEEHAAQARDAILSKAEVPFSVDKTLRHIGFELSNFTNSLNDLQADPSSIPLRSNFISAGKSLTQSIRLTFNTLADLQREADNRVVSVVGDINTITQKIATLNVAIGSGESAEQKNLGLRDQRDQLLQDLSKKISINSVEDSRGQVNIYLSNGFALVNGPTASQFNATKIPSFGGNRRAMDDGVLSAIVWDSDSSATVNDVDFTGTIAQGSGELAGLLQARGVHDPAAPDVFYLAEGDLPDIGSRIEAITQILIRDFNEIYRPHENAGLSPIASSGLDGSQPPIFGLFNVADVPPIAGLLDTNGNDREDYTDMINSGYKNFSSIINFVPDDPVKVALSKDDDIVLADNVTHFSAGNGQIATDLLNELRIARPNIGVGTFSTNNLSLEDIYNQTVSFVGGLKSGAASDLEFAIDKRTQSAELKNSESGVSMDEELTKLIGYQKTFQASSKLIKLGSDLLEELLNAVS